MIRISVRSQFRKLDTKVRIAMLSGRVAFCLQLSVLRQGVRVIRKSRDLMKEICETVAGRRYPSHMTFLILEGPLVSSLQTQYFLYYNY
jgi:hypothetical protein